MDRTADSIFCHKSMETELDIDTEDEPAPPSVELPPTETDIEGFVGRVYNVNDFVIYL